MKRVKVKRRIAFLMVFIMVVTIGLPKGVAAKQKDSLIITNIPEAKQMIIGVAHDFNKNLIRNEKEKGTYVTKWILSNNKAKATVNSKGEVVAKKSGTFVLTAKNYPTKATKKKYGSSATTLTSKSIKIQVLKNRIITQDDIKNGKLTVKNQAYGNVLIENSVGDAEITLSKVKVAGQLIMQKGASYQVVTENSSIASICTSASDKVTIFSTDEKTQEVPRLIIKSGSEVSQIILESHMDITQEGSAQIVSVQVKSSANGKLEVSLNGFKGELIVETEEGADVTIHTTQCNIQSATIEGKSTNNKIEIKDEATSEANASQIAKVNVKGKSQLSLDVNSEKVTVSGNDVALNVQRKVTELVTEGKNAKVEVTKEAAIVNVSAKGENTEIKGDGKVETVKVEGNNSSINTNGTKVLVKEDVQGVTAGGNKVEAGSQTTTTGNNTTNGSTSGGTTVDTDPEAKQKAWFNEAKPKLDAAIKEYIYYLFGDGRKQAALDQTYTDTFYQKILDIYNTSSLSLAESYKPSDKRSIAGMELFNEYIYDDVLDYMCAVDPVYKENCKLILDNNLTAEEEDALCKKLSTFNPTNTYSCDAAKNIKPACENLFFFYNRFMNIGENSNTTTATELDELVKIVNGKEWRELTTEEKKNAKDKVIEIIGLMDTSKYNVLENRTSKTNEQILAILNNDNFTDIAMEDICWNTAKEGRIKYYSMNYNSDRNKDRFGKRIFIYESLAEIIRDVNYAEVKGAGYESLREPLKKVITDLYKSVTLKENGSDKWVEIVPGDYSTLKEDLKTLLNTHAEKLLDTTMMENKATYLNALNDENIDKFLINTGFALLILQDDIIYQLDAEKIDTMRGYQLGAVSNSILSSMEWVGKYATSYRESLKEKTDQAVMEISKLVVGDNEDIVSGREETLSALSSLVNAAYTFAEKNSDNFAWYIGKDNVENLDGFVRRAKDVLQNADESTKTKILKKLYVSLQSEGEPLNTYYKGDKSSLAQLMDVTENIIMQIE